MEVTRIVEKLERLFFLGAYIRSGARFSSKVRLRLQVGLRHVRVQTLTLRINGSNGLQKFFGLRLMIASEQARRKTHFLFM